MKRIHKTKVAGTVILYNSKIDVLTHIKTYIDQINLLIVIDNSEIENFSLTSKLKDTDKVLYIFLGGNKGIATALNKAAELALLRGYDYLLTMDDDTSAPSTLISEMLHFLNNSNLQIGIIAGQSVARPWPEPYRSVYITITSGNLLNLSVYEKLGPFLDTLFIDWVDHEYCMRLQKNGYAIIELNHQLLHHTIGERKKKNILGFEVSWSSHSPIRTYYRYRNTLYVSKMYFGEIPYKYWLIFTYELTKDTIKNLALEENRRERAKLIWLAIVHFMNKKMGKLILDEC
ncbi:glycosyltransferase [Fibrella sp. ES10-3-2-2]|nr:hypothetical protein A6C57_05905 [Fibrella sp. ES10-3-2-2]